MPIPGRWIGPSLELRREKSIWGKSGHDRVHLRLHLHGRSFRLAALPAPQRKPYPNNMGLSTDGFS